MTVFNAATFLTKAIESILSQDYENFELIISDNASEDGSSDICQKFVKHDKRIRYSRNTMNMGPIYNSQKAISRCSGDFIMTAADHDIYDPGFISCLLTFLQQDESIVLAYPLTTLIDQNDRPIELMSDRIDTRCMDVCQRFSKVIWESCAMNMVYGLFRIAAFKEATMKIDSTIGPDLVQMAKLSLIGAIAQIKKPLFFRRRNRDKETVQQMTRRQVGWFFKSGIKALVPWTTLAYEQIKVIRESNLSLREKELLLTDVKNCYRMRFGALMRSEANDLLKRSDQIILESNSYPSIQLDNYLQLNENVQLLKYFIPEMPELNQFESIRLLLSQDSKKQNVSITPYYQSVSTPIIAGTLELPSMNGDRNSHLQSSDISVRKIQRNNYNLKLIKLIEQGELKLYAGDVPQMSEYDGWIGISLTQENNRHIRHDVTYPFPVPDNSVDSFQSEDVFEHIQYDRIPSIMNEIFRVLKPAGLFRLSIPDYGCDILRDRSEKDVCGGTKENPGHVWFPRIDLVTDLIEKTDFSTHGSVRYLHYYNMDGSFVVKPVDYSKGHVQRTPDFDKRVKSTYRPLSMIIDLVKMPAIPALEKPEYIKGMTSIIIPVESLHLNECVLSIKKNTDSPYEIIFLEHSAAPKVKKQMMKAITWNSAYRFIKIAPLTSFTQSLNEGINQSTGEFIVMLFDDVIVGEGWLDKMLEYIDREQRIDIACPASNNPSGRQKIEHTDITNGEDFLLFQEQNHFKRISAKILNGFCLIFRRDLLD